MDKKRLVDGTTALAEKQPRVIKIEPAERPQNVRLRVAAYTRVSSDSEDQLNSFPHPNFLLLQRRTDGQRTGCFWRIFFQRSRTPHCLFHAENGLSVRRRFSGKRELLPEGFRRDHVV